MLANLDPGQGQAVSKCCYLCEEERTLIPIILYDHEGEGQSTVKICRTCYVVLRTKREEHKDSRK